MKRHKHSLSHYKLTSCSMGMLIPTTWFTVIPGDTVQMSTSVLTRVSPLKYPVMHPLRARVLHVYCPMRLLWEDWEEFRTGFDKDGAASTKTFPTIALTNPTANTLSDYLGIPPGTYSVTVNALPYRMYSLVYNELMRDQQLQAALTIDLTDGGDSTTNTALKTINWERDYFTLARTSEQLGSEVTLPLGTTAPILGDDTQYVHWANADDSDHAMFRAASSTNIESDSTTSGTARSIAFKTGTVAGLTADLTNATAASINDLREAFALQKYAEARNRYGARYVEFLRYLGIKSSDGRLDRPEVLGSGQATIQFSEAMQTGPTTDGTGKTGVGILAGHGIGAMRSNRFRRFFEEDGIVMSFLSYRPRTMYGNGIHKEWLKTTKEEFWNKELQDIGAQAIQNNETYYGHSSPTGTFGYVDRYEEMRNIPSGISADFRNSNANFAHLARIFAGDTALNSSFITCDASNRIFQSTSEHQFQCMVKHSIQARRLLKRRGTATIRNL